MKANQPTLEPVQEMALTPAGESDTFTKMVERVVSDPNASVEKLERLLAMQERIMAIQAKSAFDAAFAQMAPELPEIDEKGKIIVKERLRSTYAKLEDIHKAIKPILARHGFAIRHRTEWPEGKSNLIRIVGILSHKSGHSEESSFEAPADKSEYRTDIQSMGSTVSYGRRYTTLDLLNLTTRGQDDDGRSAGRPQPPEGYEAWIGVLEGIASSGQAAYTDCWNKSDPKFKTFCANHDSAKWAEIKALARGAK